MSAIFATNSDVMVQTKKLITDRPNHILTVVVADLWWAKKQKYVQLALRQTKKCGFSKLHVFLDFSPLDMSVTTTVNI